MSAHRAVLGASPVARDSGLLLLEHLNLKVPSLDVATEFYTALGCVRDAARDPKKTAWFNSGGFTQIHTPSPATGAVVPRATQWPGTVELQYGSLDSLCAAVERLKASQLKVQWRGEEASLGALSADRPDAAGAAAQVRAVFLEEPYGNTFVLSLAPSVSTKASETSRSAVDLDLDLGGGSGGAEVEFMRSESTPRGVIGLAALSLKIPPGTAAQAARFYSEIMGFEVEQMGPESWAVIGGPKRSQRLLLKEDASTSGDHRPDTHIGIYIGDFEGCFSRLHSRGLIFEKESQGVTVRSLEDAQHHQTFRFTKVVDVATSLVLFELEHEIFSRKYKDCPLQDS
ncbi:unnamed protein product [Polarella glacialis]|nr:unnamed protein product [Polarella glacialis]CAE8706147.1 unnamed protein product [Polarella glacialis]